MHIRAADPAGLLPPARSAPTCRILPQQWMLPADPVPKPAPIVPKGTVSWFFPAAGDYFEPAHLIPHRKAPGLGYRYVLAVKVAEYRT